MRLDSPNIFDRQNLRWTLFRPFVGKPMYFSQNVNEMQYQMPRVFPYSAAENKTICFSGIGSSKPFQVLATDRVYSLDLLEKTQCLPLYRYTPEGERVSNITEWGIRRINDHYREEWGKDFDKIYPDGIGAEDVSSPTPTPCCTTRCTSTTTPTTCRASSPACRCTTSSTFGRVWATSCLTFTSASSPQSPTRWSASRRRLSLSPPKSGRRPPRPATPQPSLPRPPPLHGWERAVGETVTAPKARLLADKERGVIVLDDQTSLAGVPPDAWRYRLGSRSALEWVLDQYKEKKPKRPDHPRALRHLPLRGPQGARHRPAAARMHRERQDDGHSGSAWPTGRARPPNRVRRPRQARVGDDGTGTHWSSEPEDEEWLKQWLEM